MKQVVSAVPVAGRAPPPPGVSVFEVVDSNSNLTPETKNMLTRGAGLEPRREQYDKSINDLRAAEAERMSEGNVAQANALRNQAEKLEYERRSVGPSTPASGNQVRTERTPTEEVRQAAPRVSISEKGTVSQETKLISDKWGLVAKEGVGGNKFWGEAREVKALDFFGERNHNVENGTPESARLQMQVLIGKAGAMGFRPGKAETAGAYLDRMATTLAKPPVDSEIVDRGNTMWNIANKSVTVRGNLDWNSPTYSAERVLSQKVLPGMEVTPAGKEFIQAQRLVQKIYNGTGVSPAPGENVDAYGRRAFQFAIKKNPVLHMDSVLFSKPPQPTGAPVPPASAPVPQVQSAPIPSPQGPRWDSQA